MLKWVEQNLSEMFLFINFLYILRVVLEQSESPSMTNTSSFSLVIRKKIMSTTLHILIGIGRSFRFSENDITTSISFWGRCGRVWEKYDKHVVANIIHLKIVCGLPHANKINYLENSVLCSMWPINKQTQLISVWILMENGNWR